MVFNTLVHYNISDNCSIKILNNIQYQVEIITI